MLGRARVLSILLLAITATTLGAQDWAKARLDASPRHREYVNLKSHGHTVQAFVVYPEVKGKAPAVILIHEIFGLTDWAKEMADELAAQGVIVIAPDLLSGKGPKGGGSSEFASVDDAVKAVSMLDPDGVLTDLDAAADYARKIPAFNGKLAVVGFCWGGTKSFAFAAHRKDLSAAFVFYGSGAGGCDHDHGAGLRILCGERFANWGDGSGHSGCDEGRGQDLRSGDLRWRGAWIYARGRGPEQQESG